LRLQELVRIRHDNNTGRWIIPFRGVWGPAGDAVVVGNMRRKVDLFRASDGAVVGGLDNAELMTAIPSRMCIHPDLPALAAVRLRGLVKGSFLGRCVLDAIQKCVSDSGIEACLLDQSLSGCQV
jgi:hypothetical protein